MADPDAAIRERILLVRSRLGRSNGAKKMADLVRYFARRAPFGQLVDAQQVQITVVGPGDAGTLYLCIGGTNGILVFV